MKNLELSQMEKVQGCSFGV